MTDEAPCSAACVQHLHHAVAAELFDEIVDQCELDSRLESGIDDDGCVRVRHRLVEGARACGESVVHGTTVTSGADKHPAIIPVLLIMTINSNKVRRAALLAATRSDRERSPVK